MPKAEYDTLLDEDKALGRSGCRRCSPSSALSAPASSSSFSLFLVFFSGGPCEPAVLHLSEDSGSAHQWQPGVRSLPLRVLLDEGGGGGLLLDGPVCSFFDFVPVSLIYLVAGMLVAFAAPRRHGCLRLVKNNYCASKRGGVHCLFVLNLIFVIIFGLLAVFLGSTLLTLGSSCSPALFWCYEVASRCLVRLFGGTAFFLRMKATRVLDECDFRA